MQRIILAVLALLAWCSAAVAQPVTVISPVTSGDCTLFNSTTVLKDTGFACGPGSTMAAFGAVIIPLGGKVAFTSGALGNGNCVSINSLGELVDAGGTCTVGGGGGTVTSGTANQLAYYPASTNSVSGVTVSGDMTAVAGAFTLNTVNANVGSFGSATQCVSVTTNAKGLITAISATTCAPPPACSSGASGLVPATGGGTANFLRADCTFASPPSTVGTIIATTQPNVSGSALTVNGNCVASSTLIGLVSAIDYVNGQGIRLNHCGPATNTTGVGGSSATPVGTPGGTTYTYAVSCVDANGGVSTSGVTFNTATGNAVLNTTNYVSLSWGACGGSGAVGYAVWGHTGGALCFMALVPSTTYFDQGQGCVTPPDWIPSTPPGTLSQWLVTSIVSGGGSALLTVAAAPSTSINSITTSHDDTVALQAAFNLAQTTAQPLYLPAGTYRTTSALTCSIGPCHIYGPGIYQGAVIQQNSAAADAIDSSFRSQFNDFSIRGVAPGVYSPASAGIFDSSGHAGTIIERVQVQFMANCFFIQSSTFVVNRVDTSCSQNIFLLGGNGLFNSDSTITNSAISPVGIPGSLGAGGILVQGGDPGGLRIVNNKINGTSYLFCVSVNGTISDGDFHIVANSMENWTGPCIIFQHTGAFVFNNIEIVANQFAGGVGGAGRCIYFPETANPVWGQIPIVGNVFSCTSDGIAMGGANGFVIEGNSFTLTNPGISIGVNATQCMIGVNVFKGIAAGSQISDGSGACTYASVTGTKPTYPH
jgi:hypothetical protein